MWLISEVVLWFAVLSRFIQNSLNTDFHEIQASLGSWINLQKMRALVFSSLRWNTRGNNLKEGKVSPSARSQRSQTKVSHLGYYSYGSMWERGWGGEEGGRGGGGEWRGRQRKEEKGKWEHKRMSKVRLGKHGPQGHSLRWLVIHFLQLGPTSNSYHPFQLVSQIRNLSMAQSTDQGRAFMSRHLSMLDT